MELDVHATRDGVFVVHHDAELPGAGPIRDLTATDVGRLRLANGEVVPTLQNSLVTLGGMEVWVEVKHLASDHDVKFLATLAAGPTPEKYAVHSFDHRIIERLGSVRPALRRGALSASYLLDPVTVLRSCGGDTLWQETSLTDAALVQQLHGAGFKIITWTTNAEAEVERVARLGVDGICGNFPDRIRAVAERAVS